MSERWQLGKLPACCHRSGFSPRGVSKLAGTVSLEQPKSWQLAWYCFPVDATARDTAADRAITAVLMENKAASAVGNHFKYEPIF